MSQIFISYRQKGTLMRAGRIADTLIFHFGSSNIFQDRASLHGGANWKETIEAQLGDCAVLIAVIGPQWLEHTGPDGDRRIDDAQDYVHLEISTALSRGIPVIPVLVGGAQRLREEMLPKRLKALAYIEPVKIEDDAWHAGMHTLLESIRRFKLNPRRIGWKNVVSLTFSTIGMFAVSPDEVSQWAAVSGLVLGSAALFLSVRAYMENRKGSPSSRNWAVGAIIFSALVALTAVDELIPDKYF